MASPTIANRTIWTGDHLDHWQLLCGTCNSLTSDRDQTYLMAQVRLRVNKGLSAGAWDETLGAHGATREVHCGHFNAARTVQGPPDTDQRVGRAHSACQEKLFASSKRT